MDLFATSSLYNIGPRDGKDGRIDKGFSRKYHVALPGSMCHQCRCIRSDLLVGGADQALAGERKREGIV